MHHAKIIRLCNILFFTWMSVRHGGALVESIAFNRRVVCSTPALAARDLGQGLPTVACALRRETPIRCPCCSRERLWVVEDLKGRYRNGRMNEWMAVPELSLKIFTLWMKVGVQFNGKHHDTILKCRFIICKLHRTNERPTLNPTPGDAIKAASDWLTHRTRRSP